MLSTDEQAFVVAYVENSYSIPLAASALGWSKEKCSRMLRDRNVRASVKEVQESVGEIDFLNESWVKAHLVRLMPMVMGDEPVPVITAAGEQITANVFKPDIAMRIVEYVAPKAAKTQINLNQVNVNQVSEKRLTRLAERLVALQSQVKSHSGTTIDHEGDPNEA